MSATRRSQQSVEFHDGLPPKRFGVLALSTDLTSEHDLAAILPQDRSRIHVTRVAHVNPTTPENLIKTLPHLTEATRLLVPDIPLDAIYYSCTAASVVIGDEAVEKAIQLARPGVPVVTPTSATRMAITRLGMKRLCILAPYLIETCDVMSDYFTSHGVDIINFDCLGVADDRDIARISAKTIVEAAVSCDDPRADGMFISCTALPAVDVIEEIESRIGKPVLTSNQASAWALMRLSGLNDQPEGFGRIFREASF